MINDLISRQKAIEAITRCTHYKTVEEMQESKEYVAGLYLDAIVDAIWAVEVVPMERRPKGKWEIYVISPFDGEGCMCSRCGAEGTPYYNFCYNCGADMREENE